MSQGFYVNNTCLIVYHGEIKRERSAARFLLHNLRGRVFDFELIGFLEADHQLKTITRITKPRLQQHNPSVSKKSPRRAKSDQPSKKVPILNYSINVYRGH